MNEKTCNMERKISLGIGMVPGPILLYALVTFYMMVFFYRCIRNNSCCSRHYTAFLKNLGRRKRSYDGYYMRSYKNSMG